MKTTTKAQRATAAGKLSVFWEGAEKSVFLASFLADNADDAETCAAVRALKVGDVVSLGWCYYVRKVA